jgi:hypothetical protein
MEDIVKINKIELASELAHDRLVREFPNIKIYEEEEAGITTYTEEAQDLFNDFYDEYLTLIESIKE